MDGRLASDRAGLGSISGSSRSRSSSSSSQISSSSGTSISSCSRQCRAYKDL
jgi:hypothetical protein